MPQNSHPQSPSVGFELLANVGYAHAVFYSDSAITGFTTALAIPHTPEVTGELLLSNDQRVWNGLEAVGSLAFNYVGSRTDAPHGVTITLLNVDSELIHLPGYGLLNLRYGLRGDDWSVTAFVTNLLNRELLLDPGYVAAKVIIADLHA